jgi:predicted nuclease of predicted toxin-antitoxin system
LKVLLDTCVWNGVRDALVAAGHDVIWAGDWDEDPGDDAILKIAHDQG